MNLPYDGWIRKSQATSWQIMLNRFGIHKPELRDMVCHLVARKVAHAQVRAFICGAIIMAIIWIVSAF